MKKIISLLLVMALTATVAIGGTLAYLTDRDSEVNTFTVGDVSIDLTENFEQGAELVPGVRVEKEAKITNTGNNDAYVWMTVAVPSVLDDENTELGSANVLHWNMPGCFWNGYHDDDKYIQSGIKDGYLPEGSTGVAAEDSWINDNKAVKETIDGIEYNVYTFKYVGAIVPGETTNIGLSRVFLDENLDIDTDGQWYIVEDGTATKVNWNSKTNGTPKVIVSAYAIQADSFADVNAAYTAYQAQWGENGTEYTPAPAIPEDATVVSTTEELNAALENGETVLYLNPGEYTVSPENKDANLTIYGSSNAVIIHKNEGEQGCDYGFQGSTVTFNGVTIDTTQNTEGWAFGYARMNGTYNNCTIKGTYFLYGVSEFNDCGFDVSGNAYNVWTYGSSAATFNGCTFNCDGKAIYMDGNGNTGTNLTVSNCVFNDRTNGASGYNKAAIETGTTYGTTYTLNVSGTTVNGFAVNPDGIATNSKVWANKHSMTTDKLNVVVDSADVY